MIYTYQTAGETNTSDPSENLKETARSQAEGLEMSFVIISKNMVSRQIIYGHSFWKSCGIDQEREVSPKKEVFKEFYF